MASRVIPTLTLTDSRYVPDRGVLFLLLAYSSFAYHIQ
jgi:hypothetical protein